MQHYTIYKHTSTVKQGDKVVDKTWEESNLWVNLVYVAYMEEVNELGIEGTVDKVTMSDGQTFLVKQTY